MECVGGIDDFLPRCVIGRIFQPEEHHVLDMPGSGGGVIVALAADCEEDQQKREVANFHDDASTFISSRALCWRIGSFTRFIAEPRRVARYCSSFQPSSCLKSIVPLAKRG